MKVVGLILCSIAIAPQEVYTFSGIVFLCGLGETLPVSQFYFTTVEWDFAHKMGLAYISCQRMRNM